jgi:hypothetical protein
MHLRLELTLGSLPGGWPADWSVAEQQVVGLEDVQQQQPLPTGLQFQVRCIANGVTNCRLLHAVNFVCGPFAGS